MDGKPARITYIYNIFIISPIKLMRMLLFAKILIGLVALEHLYILWLEMFAWTTAGKKTFRSLPAHLFEETKTLAANQGLYNGFIGNH